MAQHFYNRGLDDNLEILRNKLTETTLLLEVLAFVNSLLSKERNFTKICLEVTRILQEKFKFKYIHIWLIDEENSDLLRLITPERTDELRTQQINKGIIGKCVREARTICAPDVTMEPDYFNAHAETKSELCIPLISSEKVIGALNIETDTYQSFAGQVSIIEIIAENLGNSLKLALLYKTEEQFYKLVEQMNEGVWVSDSQERAIYTNPALQKMMGYTEKEIRGKTPYIFLTEEGKKIVEQETAKRKTGLPGHYEITFVARNNEHIPVLIHAVPFGDHGTMATITDLRQIKITEQKLFKTESFLASITQHCPEAIVGTNEDCVIQSWNVGAERMFGFKTSEAIGQNIKIIVPEDRLTKGELQQLIHEARSKEFVRNFETVRLHKNGQPITTSLNLSAIKDNRGKVIGFSVLYRDITAQKKWERELQNRFEKMQEAYREMGRQRRYLDYITDISTMATSSDASKKQISTFIVNAMIVITRVDGVTLRLLNESSGKLVLTAQSGLGEEWWTKKNISYSGSLLETAVRNKHPLKILDILSDPRYSSPALARKNNLRSALIIPLEIKGQVLGSLTLYLSQEGNLSILDDEFIAVFAKQVSLALKLAT